MKVARNEKRKKLLGFSFYTNIGNFKAFLWNLNLSANHLFWRCVFERSKRMTNKHYYDQIIIDVKISLE